MKVPDEGYSRKLNMSHTLDWISTFLLRINK